jgi:hypothetical protein
MTHPSENGIATITILERRCAVWERLPRRRKWTTSGCRGHCGGNARNTCPSEGREKTPKAASREPPRGRSPTPSGTCFGPGANGRASIAIGSGSQRASSMSVSRGGEGGHIREAVQEDGRLLCERARRDLLEVAPVDSKHFPALLGGEKVGKKPTHRGKLGAKINLLVDERAAPLSVVLTGANRHDTRSPLSA